MNGTDFPADYDRHRAALDIVDLGACNPSGVALALHNACRQAIAEGVSQRAANDKVSPVSISCCSQRGTRGSSR